MKKVALVGAAKKWKRHQSLRVRIKNRIRYRKNRFKIKLYRRRYARTHRHLIKRRNQTVKKFKGKF